MPIFSKGQERRRHVWVGGSFVPGWIGPGTNSTTFIPSGGGSARYKCVGLTFVLLLFDPQFLSVRTHVSVVVYIHSVNMETRSHPPLKKN